MFEKLQLTFSKYEGAKEISCEKIDFKNSGDIQGCKFLIDRLEESSQDCQGSKIRFTVESGEIKQGSVGISLTENHWSKENYLFIPAAVYNGNRYKAVHQKYPPILYKNDDIGADMETTISDVPRFNIGEGKSIIQMKSADMASPAICVYDKDKQIGFILLFSYKTELGYNGVSLEENGDRTACEIRITAPAVRQERYTMCNAKAVSKDRGGDFKKGDSVELEIKRYNFNCNSVEELYDKFFELRYELAENGDLAYELPYSAQWEISERKHNRENWNEDGYYKVGTEDGIYQDFQSGWVGGGMNIYPLYLLGGKQSKERAKSTLAFIIDKLQLETGFFYGIYYKGKPYGDCFTNVNDTAWLLLRKNADMLIFLIKTWALINEDDREFGEKCKTGLMKAADGFVKLWRENNQWGQYIDVLTGEITLGGTASAGAAVAALVLAHKHFKKNDYLETAKKAAAHYYSEYTKKGLTNGGPGEILQTPDSESAFALLESFVMLYEHTGEREWLKAAEASAKQAATWCVSYNFEFPKGSEFQRLNMKTVGSVYANCQNKHSAPGICTFSGDSLLKLYRFTGDNRYLRLITEIAHNITQYTSREDRPIRTLDGRLSPEGYMNERVNMCDWEEQEMVGSVFYGSCWCECSAMLTVADLPSVYIKDKEVTCFDNVRAVLKDNKLTIMNPTKFDARVSVLVDSDNTVSLEQELLSTEKYFVKAGETVVAEV